MDDTVSVLFGDNINGKAPDSGSTIVLQYIESAGADGNVTYTDKITTINDTIYNATQVGDIWSYVLAPDVNGTLTYNWNLTTATDNLSNQNSVAVEDTFLYDGAETGSPGAIWDGYTGSYSSSGPVYAGD